MPFGKMEVSIELNSIGYDASVSFLTCLPAYLQILTYLLMLYHCILSCYLMHDDDNNNMHQANIMMKPIHTQQKRAKQHTT